jgi:hypothetical protein
MIQTICIFFYKKQYLGDVDIFKKKIKEINNLSYNTTKINILVLL